MPNSSAELRGLRILVVEDEFLVALELESMLQDLGGPFHGPNLKVHRAHAHVQDLPPFAQDPAGGLQPAQCFSPRSG